VIPPLQSDPSTEDQYQAEKMRALGQFAASVAGDFNNVLTGILGQLALVSDAMATGDMGQAASDLVEVETSAQRGAELVRKLMGFSRKQTLRPTHLRASDLLEEASSFLRVLLPPGITLETRMVQDGWVLADPVLVEHILLNLATNARDAMPDGGDLRIEAGRRVIDEESVATWGWGEPGEFLVVRMRDTGTGMPPDVLDRVLDPFFTTKAEGRGMGLGLAMVYGLMKQHGGWIRIDSTVGSGTSVELLFPLAEPPEATASARERDGARGGSERILVAEDDESIRTALTRVLRRHGYTVRTASDGLEALMTVRVWPEADLVITDVAMPNLSGPALARAAEEEGIDVAFLYTSGEGSEQVRRTEGLPARSVFLPKPWTVSDLLGRVRMALDRHRNRDVRPPR
jgi:two-component system, cell cycle sensor histidine kinase and response regulator CckA